MSTEDKKFQKKSSGSGFKVSSPKIQP